MVRDKPNTVWKQYQNRKEYNQSFFDIQSAQEEVKKFKKELIIHGLAIKTTDVETSTSCNARFISYIESLCKNFKGETKNLDFKKEKAESELIAFITTHITCLMNGSKDKELIKKTY